MLLILQTKFYIENLFIATVGLQINALDSHEIIYEDLFGEN